jgi:hypothetical protein
MIKNAILPSVSQPRISTNPWIPLALSTHSIPTPLYATLRASDAGGQAEGRGCR